MNLMLERGAGHYLFAYISELRKQSVELWPHLNRNKVVHAALKEVGSQLLLGGGLPPALAVEVNSSKRAYEAALDLLISLRGEAQFVLIKALPGFEYIGSDVDVLARSDADFEQLRVLLSQDGFVRLKASRFKLWDPYNERDKEMWQKAGGDCSIVHLHRNVAWDGVVYVDRSMVFATAVEREVLGRVFKVPGSKESLLIAAAHILFETHQITLGDFIQIDLLLEAQEFEIEAFLRDAGTFGWALGARQILEYNTKIKSRLMAGPFLLLPLLIPKISLVNVRLGKVSVDLLHLKLQDSLRASLAYGMDLAKLFIYRPLKRHFR
ncbi:MAG: hypothetical protein HY687_05180 [Chloroflexi bacterium]|nr:hypothetical protein [Chloroflexota bacterium]